MREPHPFRAGLWAAAPLAPGLVAVGILYGASAVEAGMMPWSVVLTSLVVGTGTAQFVAVELLSQGQGWFLVALAGLLVNLRYVVYSLQLGPFASALPPWLRLAYLGVVSDEGYALTTPRACGLSPGKRADLLWSGGLMLVVWGSWQVGTVVGAVSGPILPPALGLEMAIPLTLLSVLVLLVGNWRHVVVAVVAGTCALLLRDAPLGLGLLLAMAAGVVTGRGLSSASASAVETAS